MGFTIELKGEKELSDFFNQMPKDFGERVLGDIAQAGASVIRSEARRQMPVDGVLGELGKKAVIIGKSKRDKTMRVVTIGNQYIQYRGKNESIGKIIRHMTAGKQNNRMRKNGLGTTGKVRDRGGDFVHKAFEAKKELAVRKMAESSKKIIERRAKKLFDVR